ncbi:membrane protein insertion efficiency factor YidD [Rhizosaccharibacter radicis]|uniref:Putative membrane protein insertion efficiency factor n=1 Tax=Rhizosaccharibacter radicis TaxID=2782605 RepID=A0ABT1VX63_9PROT|nr:membrane protein insertion efficiency factor YidD [Acetobacteraceae bacterium KSS12]
MTAALPFTLLIRLYQIVLRPVLGPNCRFTPGCSDYALQALQQHGAWSGSLLAAKRVARCHPWHPGGYDPVPTGRCSCGRPSSRSDRLPS